MNNIYEIQFLQSDDTDITTLISLLKSEGLDVQTNSPKENDMGIDLFLLTILIPPVTTITTKLLDVLNVWLQNRSVEVVLKNKKTQKEIIINSKRGKLPSKEELDNLKSILR